MLLEGEQLCGAFVLTGQADGQSAVEWADPAAKALYLDRLGIDPGCSGQGIGGCVCLWWTAIVPPGGCTGKRDFPRFPGYLRRTGAAVSCTNTDTKSAYSQGHPKQKSRNRGKVFFSGLAAFFNPHYNREEIFCPKG